MKTASLQTFHRRLAAWYEKHGRHDLPWRRTRDPYRIWVSEVMLQQTQVKTVVERYWKPFLKQFPTLQALARAPRQKVLKVWEGMGYYNRAVNLHEAVREVAGTAERAGIKPKLPESIEELMALPGIGKNTAHAVAAFAYRQPVPVMEANVKRVLCRIFALKAPTEKVLWQKAKMLLGQADPFDYNQAMMDVGALVCTPKAPDCRQCPANKLCRGRKTPEIYPTQKKKRVVPVRKRTIVVLSDGKRYLMGKREGKFLSGLYGFPEAGPGSVSAVVGKMVYLLTPQNLLGKVRHVYSHFILEAKIHQVVLSPGRAETVAGTWRTLAQIAKLPISGSDKKIIDLIKKYKLKN